jgi:hypothetical protein
MLGKPLEDTGDSRAWAMALRLALVVIAIAGVAEAVLICHAGR